MRKSIIDLNEQDLMSYPVWYFPGESEIPFFDELMILPATQSEVDNDYGIIVKCVFASKDKKYNGYLHWQAPYTIDAVQPVLFLDDKTKIMFWHGIFPPNEDELNQIRVKTGEDFFPVTYDSVNIFSLKSLSGKLDGLYYFDNDDVLRIIR